jgi:hypothetical protein
MTTKLQISIKCDEFVGCICTYTEEAFLQFNSINRLDKYKIHLPLEGLQCLTMLKDGIYLS